MKTLLLRVLLAIALITTFSCAAHNQQLIGAMGGAAGAGAALYQGLSPTAIALYTIGGVVGGSYIGNAIDQKKQKGRDIDQYNAIQNNREKADRLWKEAEERQSRQAASVNVYNTGGSGYSGGGGGAYISPGSTDCEKVTTRQWANGTVVSENTREVCRGNRSTSTY